MAFIDDIRKLAESALELKDKVNNEAETKAYLIGPFIRVLGYKDLPDLRLEYPADVGAKQGEKVDYAIFKDGSPAILFECKTADIDLDSSHVDQLYRYFSNIKEARFGVLTNGLVYQFYTDLENKNLMDHKPFLEFKLSDIQEPLVEELEKFTKAKFDADNIWNTAHELKHIREIKHILATEYESPSKEFVIFCNEKVFNKEESDQSVIEEFTGYTKRAFHQFVTERTKERQTHRDEDMGQPLSELNPQKGDPNPTEISFPDKTTVSIKSWRDMMEKAVHWLIDNNILNTSHSPIPAQGSSSKRYLVSTKPIHSNGKEFTSSSEIGTFYIETHFNASNIVPQVRHIIQHVGQDPAQFKVRW